jgi:hypothetical protein
MSMMRDFDKEFVERTKELLEGNIQEKAIEYDVTLQLNCLLAMVMLPLERKRNSNASVDAAFKKNCIDYLKKHSTITKGAGKEDVYLAMDIRDAIAHLRIEVEPDAYGNIDKVILTNNYSTNNEFSCSMKVKDLKGLALHVTNEYLKNYF